MKSKILAKGFSSLKGNDKVIADMQKGLGFNFAEAAAKLSGSAKKVSPKKVGISKGMQAGVTKLGKLHTEQAGGTLGGAVVGGVIATKASETLPSKLRKANILPSVRPSIPLTPKNAKKFVIGLDLKTGLGVNHETRRILVRMAKSKAGKAALISAGILSGAGVGNLLGKGIDSLLGKKAEVTQGDITMDKAAQLFNQIAKVDSTYVSKKGLEPYKPKIDTTKIQRNQSYLAPQGSPVTKQTPGQRQYSEVFGNKPNPYKMELKNQKSVAPTESKAPVTSAPKSKSSGNFNTAFANARKQGLKTFDFGGKKYTTQLKGEAPSKDYKYVNENLPNKTQSLVKNVKENTPITVTGTNKSTPIVARGIEKPNLLKQQFEMQKAKTAEYNLDKEAQLLGALGKSVAKIFSKAPKAVTKAKGLAKPTAGLASAQAKSTSAAMAQTAMKKGPVEIKSMGAPDLRRPSLEMKMRSLNKTAQFAKLLGTIGSKAIAGAKTYGKNIVKDYKGIGTGMKNIEKARTMVGKKGLSKVKQLEVLKLQNKGYDAIGSGVLGLGKRVGLPAVGAYALMN